MNEYLDQQLGQVLTPDQIKEKLGELDLGASGVEPASVAPSMNADDLLSDIV